MLKIITTTKPINHSPKKFTHLSFTEKTPPSECFLKNQDGTNSLQINLGKYKNLNQRTFRTAIRNIVQVAKKHHLEFISLELKMEDFPQLQSLGERWFMRTLVENLCLADYQFETYKTKKKKTPLSEILICGLKNNEGKTGVTEGLISAEYINKARNLANLPGCDLTPTAFAKNAQKLMLGSQVSVKILNEQEIKRLKMGALYAVGQGAETESKFIIAEYWGAGKNSQTKPIVLVGKGITYDTGGLNVKPAGSMHEMHMDMSGGATVLATVAAVAKLGLKKNVIALVPSAENAISAKAMRAGDIVTAMNGKTIEILHTDAEGRLVLADALTYSERYKPGVIIDVATLTGASLVALGQQASVIMTKDKTLSDKLGELGEVSGDLVWPLPLWDEYRESLKSYRADISNIATNFSRFGGCIEGGIFLSHFVPKKTPWVHIDIAPRMDSIASDKLAKGSTGEPIRLLISFIEQY